MGFPGVAGSPEWWLRRCKIFSTNQNKEYYEMELGLQAVAFLLPPLQPPI
jgi:hypothetical protein